MIASKSQPPEADQTGAQSSSSSSSRASPPSSSSPPPPPKPLTETPIDIHTEIQDILDSDLKCAICQDIYINPTILNCSHSFCRFCVQRWLSRKTVCPQCRVTVSFQAENLALRNIVSKMIQKSSPQFQSARTTSVSQRLKDEEAQQNEEASSALLKRERESIDGRRGIGSRARLRSRAIFSLGEQYVVGVENSDTDDYLFEASDTNDSVWSNQANARGQNQFTYLFRRGRSPTASFLRNDESDTELEEDNDDNNSADNSDLSDSNYVDIQIDSSSSDSDDDLEDDEDDDEAEDREQDDREEGEEEEDDDDDDEDFRPDWVIGMLHDQHGWSSSESDIQDIDVENVHEDTTSLSSVPPSESSDPEAGAELSMDDDSNLTRELRDGHDSDESTEVYDSMDRYRYSDDSTVEYATDDDSDW